jgi:Spy/CpxP family protein refolding chaperone
MRNVLRGLALLLFLTLSAVAPNASAFQAPAAAPAPPPSPGTQPRTELSDAQRKAINVVLADAKTKIAPITATVGSGVKELRRNLLARGASPTARQQLLDRISKGASQLVILRIDTTARILALLTPEQKDLVSNEETATDYGIDVYEVLVKVFGLPKMG